MSTGVLHEPTAVTGMTAVGFFSHKPLIQERHFTSEFVYNSAMSAIPPLIKSRHRRRERYQKGFSKRLSRIALGFLIIVSLIITAGIIIGSILFAGLSKALPSLETLPLSLGLKNDQLPQPSRLFDRRGEQILAILENPAAGGREYLTVENGFGSSVSKSLVSATIASTEPGYWTNPLFRLDNLQDDFQLTIAQRIIRSNLLEDQSLSFERILIERILAAQIISRFGREKVLEWYLNSADYGNHAYGADAAARVYFGKSARKLSLAEAALLAAAAESPSLNPIDAPIAANERKERILFLMFEQGIITKNQYDSAISEETKIRFSEGLTLDVAPGFTKLVIEQAGNFIPPAQLFRGGFDIITTLDYELQNQVECTIKVHSSRISQDVSETGLEDCEMARLLSTVEIDNSEEDINIYSSVIVTDPNSGQVLSMAGEGGTGHPPGSILTPFIYLSSFTRGASPASMVWDIPANLIEGLPSVRNPDGEFHGPVSLRSALANDYLVPAIQTLSQMNPDQVWQTTRQMGINTLQVPEEDDGILMLFEGGKADLLEISQAYGVFASQGSLAGISKDGAIPQNPIIPVTPQVVLEILDQNGNKQLDCTEEISDCRSIKRPVITPQLAYLITDILSDETARWPSLGHPNPLEIGRPTAAKIGFTNTREDAWTVGYTPSLVVSVWIGTEESGQELSNTPNWAAGLWRAVIQFAMKDQPIEEFIPPVGISEIQVCNPSGLLPTEGCPHIVDEVFASGNEPTQTDNLFQTFLVNRESGRLATIFTSPVLIDEQTFMIIPPEAEDWAREADIPKVPDAYDVVDSEQISSINASITSPKMFDTIHGSLPIIGRAAGANFEFYRLQYGAGLNPKTWLQIGEDVIEPVRNGQLGVWDTSDLSGLYALQLIVSYTDGTVESATIQVTIDNQKPYINIQYPGENDVFSVSREEELTILVEANDDLELASVEILIDEELVASLKNPPYAVPWNLESGEHVIRVKAIDRAGNVSDTRITFIVEE